MAYSEKQRNDLIDGITDDMINGKSLRYCLKKYKLPFSTFFSWMDKYPKKAEQYARACTLRAEFLADEILEISDATAEDIIIDSDGKEVINHHVIQRDKLRADNRKWIASKMFPKKYGDKQAVDMTITEKSPFKGIDLSDVDQSKDD